VWRSLADYDIPAISALAATCLAADGGLPLAATDAFIQAQYALDPPGMTLGAFDTADHLVACASVKAMLTANASCAAIIGQVHPMYRQQGLGTFLLRWSVAQARLLLEDSSAEHRRLLSLSNESFTEAAAQLYVKHGWTEQFVEEVMRRPLDLPLPATSLPVEVALVPWTSARAEQFFDVYQAAFRERPGYPSWSAEQWVDWITDDDDFCPERSLLACVSEHPVGFVVCSDNWIVQIGVRPPWRGRGLGSALVGEVLRRVRAMGGEKVLLTVNTNNPSAIRVYERLGFASIGQRARYEQKLP